MPSRLRFPGNQTVSATELCPVTPFFEHGRLPVRPSPTEPAIIRWKTLKTSRCWLVFQGFFRPSRDRLECVRERRRKPLLLSASRSLPDSDRAYNPLFFNNFSAHRPQGGLRQCCSEYAGAHLAGDVPLIQLDLDVDSGRQLQLHQCINRLVRWVHDIHQAFMGPDLVLVASVLVHMR